MDNHRGSQEDEDSSDGFLPLLVPLAEGPLPLLLLASIILTFSGGKQISSPVSGWTTVIHFAIRLTNHIVLPLCLPVVAYTHEIDEDNAMALSMWASI
jgi:hypothetical protein